MKGKLASFITLGMACAAFTSVIAMAGTADADPANPVGAGNTVALSGSDTIQDYFNAFGTTVGGAPGQNQAIGSWDAVEPSTQTPHTLITSKNTKACTNITRPNGSGEGVAALRRSLSGTAAVDHVNSVATGLSVPVPLGSGCFDAARSSSDPGAAAVSGGLLTYVPFAEDAVAMATGPATATNITNADSFTEQNLIDLYSCNTTVVGGVTYDPNTGHPNGTQIDLYVPQPGSGTRSFWSTTLGFNGTTLPDCVHDHSVVTPSLQVEEHDGTVLASDPNGIAPFSIAQWISQARGTNDRRHGAVIHTLKGLGSGATPQAPTTGDPTHPTTLLLNPNFPINRHVFVVIPSSSVGSSDLLDTLFVGPNSIQCLDRDDITGSGFAPIGAQCGDTSITAFDNVAGPTHL